MPLYAPLEAARQRPAQAALAHHDVQNAASVQGRRDAASRRLDFRKLGHDVGSM